jgi:5-methylcytosine-specific restriction endonuclease McrA
VKVCPKCGLQKSLDDFGPNVKRGDGLQSYCRVCRREYLREHYARNADRYRMSAAARNKRRRDAVRRIIREAKDRECADCGVRYPFYVMDFDHRVAAEKRINIGRDAMRGRCSLDDLMKEIDKCDVLCANCHRARTHRRDLQLGRQDSNLD